MLQTQYSTSLERSTSRKIHQLYSSAIDSTVSPQLMEFGSHAILAFYLWPKHIERLTGYYLLTKVYAPVSTAVNENQRWQHCTLVTHTLTKPQPHSSSQQHRTHPTFNSLWTDCCSNRLPLRMRFGHKKTELTSGRIVSVTPLLNASFIPEIMHLCLKTAVPPHACTCLWTRGTPAVSHHFRCI